MPSSVILLTRTIGSSAELISLRRELIIGDFFRYLAINHLASTSSGAIGSPTKT